MRVGRRAAGTVLICSLVTTAVLGTALPAEGQGDTALDRGGFTMLVNAGVGFQHDSALGDSFERGFAGVNLGIGGFLTRNVSLVFRLSSTSRDSQGSGVGGPAVQVWLSDRFHVESGGGVGWWDAHGFPGASSDPAFGLIFGAGYALWGRGRHTLRLGVEYAPAFTQPETVHNVGISIGWQLL